MAAVLDPMKSALPSSSVDDISTTARESADFLCRWDGCGVSFGSGEDLYQHLCTSHVIRRPKHNGSLLHGANDGSRDSAAPRASYTKDQFIENAAPAPSKPARLYCHWQDCNVTVQKRDHMTSHIRIHIDMKPYACSQCDKKFKRTQDLKKHLRTHPEEKTPAAHKARATQATTVDSSRTSPPVANSAFAPCSASPAAILAASMAKRAAPPASDVAAALPTSSAARGRRARPAFARVHKQRDHTVATKADLEQAHADSQNEAQQSFHDYIDSPDSDSEKQRAISASLALLADIHSAQVKPEFSESLAERFDTISLILKDEKLLQRVSETLTRSDISTSEQLGELYEFLEQVTESITAQQTAMRVRQEEQPLSEIVYSSMKPVFPPLPFEPGTEADFLSGPNYFADMIESTQQHFQNQRSYIYGKTQATMPADPHIGNGARGENEYSTSHSEATSTLLASADSRSQHSVSDYVAADQASRGVVSTSDELQARNALGLGPSDSVFQRMPRGAPDYLNNAPLDLPRVGVEPEISEALDYYLDQMETQMTAEHTLEVTSGLRTLINDVMEPEARHQGPHDLSQNGYENLESVYEDVRPQERDGDYPYYHWRPEQHHEANVYPTPGFHMAMPNHYQHPRPSQASCAHYQPTTRF